MGSHGDFEEGGIDLSPSVVDRIGISSISDGLEESIAQNPGDTASNVLGQSSSVVNFLVILQVSSCGNVYESSLMIRSSKCLL